MAAKIANKESRAGGKSIRKKEGAKSVSIELGSEAKAEQYILRLYVAGQTPKSLAAFANLKNLCEEYLSGRYRIEVIDLMANPQLASGDQIFALPTLVRKLPEPLKRIVGNLSDKEKFLVGMDLKPQS